MYRKTQPFSFSWKYRLKTVKMFSHKCVSMNGKLRNIISVVCLVLSVVIVGLAYFSDYDYVLTKPNVRWIILLLLLINVIANIADIESFFEKLYDDRTRIEEERLYGILCKVAKDLEILLSSNQSQFPERRTKKGVIEGIANNYALENSYTDSPHNEVLHASAAQDEVQQNPSKTQEVAHAQ